MKPQTPKLILAAAVALGATSSAFAGTTWDAGGGATTDINLNTNWDGDVVNALDGTTAAIFGTGGSTATINTNASFSGITINRNGNFAIANGAGSLTVGTGGITVTLPNTTGRTHTISESSLILGGSQIWSVTNNTGAAALNVSSVISDGGSGYGITKTGTGTLTLSGVNTYTGTTTVNGGLLALNFPVTQNNVLSSSSALALGGGSLLMNQAANTTATQTINGVTVNQGASYISVLRNSGATITLNLGNITQGSVGGTLAIIPPSNSHKVTSTATNVNNIIGGWAVIGVGGGTPTDFAKANGGATLIGAPVYTTDTWAAGNNTNVTTTSAPASDSTTNSLRFATNSSSTLTLSGVNTITSGGILVAGAVKTGSDQVITGGTLKGSASGALYIHQFSGEGNLNVNTGLLGVGGTLTINSIIADNGGATALVKTGGSKLILGGANSFAGGIYLNQGELQLAASGTLNGNSVTFGSNATASPNYSGIMIAAPTLTINGLDTTLGGLQTQAGYAGPNAIVQNANATAATLTVSNATDNTFAGVIQNGTGTPTNGALSLIKSAAGTLTLSGANTYTGTTTVAAGVLALGTTGSVASTVIDVQLGATLDKDNGLALAAQTLKGRGTVDAGAANTLAMSASSILTPGTADDTVGALAVTGSLSLNSSAYDYDFTGGSAAADLVDLSGGLTLSSATINFSNLGTYTLNDKFTLFAYDGTLSGLFTGYADDTKYTFAGGEWLFNYDDATAGLNGGSGLNYITITAIPEPTTTAFGLLAMGGLLLRRRRD